MGCLLCDTRLTHILNLILTWATWQIGKLRHRAGQSLGQGQTVEKPQKLSSSNHSAPLKNSSEVGGPEPCGLGEEAVFSWGHAWLRSDFPFSVLLSAILGHSGPHKENQLLSEAGPWVLCAGWVVCELQRFRGSLLSLTGKQMAQTSLYTELSPGSVNCAQLARLLYAAWHRAGSILQIKNLRPGEKWSAQDPTAYCGRTGSVLGFPLPSPWSAWSTQLQLVADIGLVRVGISVSFSFIRSLGATFFLGDDYVFLKLN